MAPCALSSTRCCASASRASTSFICTISMPGRAAARRTRNDTSGRRRAAPSKRSRSCVRAATSARSESGSRAARIIRALDLDCVMIAGRYSLLNQEAQDDLFPLCLERNVGVLAAGPFNGGLLVRGPASGVRYNYAEPPAEIVDRLDRLQAICQRHGV